MKIKDSKSRERVLSPCSCAVCDLWFCVAHRELLFIMFHHGTRGKAEDREHF